MSEHQLKQSKTNKLFVGALGVFFFIFISMCCFIACLGSLTYAFVYSSTDIIDKTTAETFIQYYFEEKCGYNGFKVKVDNIPKARMNYFSLNSGVSKSATVSFTLKDSNGNIIETGEMSLLFTVGSGEILNISKINDYDELEYICK